MNEILFRGKIINRDLTLTKEWIYGSYCDEAKSPIKLKGEKDYILCPHISKYDQYYSLKGFGNLGAPHFYPVLPKTVGQYTGKELDGKKIFTGDIIESYEDYDDNFGYPETSTFISVVIWDEKNFCFAFKTDDYIQPFNDWNWENSKLIGNIHDNPELLKGE